MASKNNSKDSTDKKSASKSKASSDASAIAELKKLLAEANAQNKKLTASYNALLKDNKTLQSSVKAVETEKNSLKKQADSYAKKEKQAQDKISKLQDDVLSSKSEISRIKKEKGNKLSVDKQEIAEKFKELKRKEKELEKERASIEKEVALLRKLKEDTKNSASSIAKSVSKMSYADSSNELAEGSAKSSKQKADTPTDGSYLSELERIFDKFATVLGETLASNSGGQSAPMPQQEQTEDLALASQTPSSNAPISFDLDGISEVLNNFAETFKEAMASILNNNNANMSKPSSEAIDNALDTTNAGSINLDRIGEILEDFAVVLKEVISSIQNAPISLDLDGLREVLNDFAETLKESSTQSQSDQSTQSAQGSPSADSTSSGSSGSLDLDGIGKILDNFGIVLQEAIKSMPAAQVTSIPITQVTNTSDPSSPESAKMMESLSSYLDEAQKHISSAPPQVIISQQTVAPPKIEGLTAAEERDTSAMISKKAEPQEASSYSDMPIMRMKLDKDDDIYEDRLVITYTFDNMPENRVYSKYKKILRNAVRITLLGNLQEGLELFNIIKNQNISEEYKSMIDRNISDITYYLRGKHRARLE